MRIAYVCADSGVPVFGYKGCSIHVQEVIRAMTELGAAVDLFAVRGTDEPRPPGLKDVAVHALPFEPAGDAASRERAAWQINAALWTALDASGPFDMVYERHSLWSVGAMRFASDQQVPGVLEVNAPLIEEQAEHRTLCDRAAAERAATAAFHAAHTIVAVSRPIADYVERFIGPSSQLHVVPNGVDPTRFIPRSSAARDAYPGIFTIGFVGSLKPWHGLPVLVDAFEELHAENSHTRLLIVGDGPERARLEDRLANRSLGESALLTGAVAPAEIPRLLAAMDAAVAPYSARPDFYFSPLKVLEYMAAGVPIVASRLGQLDGLIVHGETGLLCAADDSHALASCLRRLRHDPTLTVAMGQAARDHVSRNHTWQATVRRIVASAGLEFHGAPLSARVTEGFAEVPAG